MNSILRRRRALMGASGKGLTISDIEPGTGVKIGTEQYIVIDRHGNKTRMLRDSLLSTTMKMYNSEPSVTGYGGSIVDTYLSETYLNTFSQSVQSFISLEYYSYTAYDGTSSETKTIQRKIVVPSRGNINDAIPALKTYYGVTTDDNARIAKKAGSASTWWLRDAFTGATGRMQYVLTTGAYHRTLVTSTSGVRPLLLLIPDTPVTIVNDEYVVDA